MRLNVTHAYLAKRVFAVLAEEILRRPDHCSWVEVQALENRDEQCILSFRSGQKYRLTIEPMELINSRDDTVALCRELRSGIDRRQG